MDGWVCILFGSPMGWHCHAFITMTDLVSREAVLELIQKKLHETWVGNDAKWRGGYDMALTELKIDISSLPAHSPPGFAEPEKANEVKGQASGGSGEKNTSS